MDKGKDAKKEATYEETLAKLQSELDSEIDNLFKRDGGDSLEKRIAEASGSDKEHLQWIAQMKRDRIESDVCQTKFNNWHHNLPYDKYQGGGYYRIGPPDELYEADEDNSPLKRQETNGDFFRDVDKAIIDVGMTSDQISKLQQERDSGSITIGALCRRTLPVYAKLIHKGYNKTDLTR